MSDGDSLSRTQADLVSDHEISWSRSDTISLRCQTKTAGVDRRGMEDSRISVIEQTAQASARVMTRPSTQGGFLVRSKSYH